MTDTMKSTPTTKPKRVRRSPIEKEIAQLQQSDKNMIPKSCFARCVKQYVGDGFRITEEAAKMLQAESEDYLTHVFSNAAMLATRTGRETIIPDDIRVQDLLKR